MNDNHDQVTSSTASTVNGGPDSDKRDSYFESSSNEQSYAMPAAPVLTPPIDNEETQQNRKENIQKTESIRPL